MKLKDFSADEKFTNKLREAFTSLKDDISFNVNTSRATIKELKKLHVDNNQYL